MEKYQRYGEASRICNREVFMSSMTKRERVLTAFSRKIPDKIPCWIQPGSYLSQIVKENTGLDSPWECFDMDIQQFVYYGPTKYQGDFSKYPSWSNNGVNEWGQGSCPPMIDFHSADDVYEYPFPDVGASYRYEHLPEAVEKVKEKGLPAVSGYECGSFEHLWALRGMDNFLADLLDEPEFLTPLIDKVSDLKAEIAAGYVKAGVDIVWTGDDLGSEIAMLMSPELWRKHLKSCVKKIASRAKSVNPDVLVAFHSDGYIEPIISDLIEVGIDILQAVQPECMDVAKLKEEYGDRLSFWGTMGTQSTMAFGTPEDVKRDVKERIMTVGKGGGLCIGPSHTLESPTPWENIVAFFEAVKAFGEY
jgi:uroporphyrinogen decarboxylase